VASKIEQKSSYSLSLSSCIVVNVAAIASHRASQPGVHLGCIWGASGVLPELQQASQFGRIDFVSGFPPRQLGSKPGRTQNL